MIAVEHPHVCQQVVGEPHGLRALQMRVPRHQRVEMLARAIYEGARQCPEGRCLGDAVLADPQQRVRDDLIIAAAPGVQAATRIAGDLREASLHGGVDVLIPGREYERARLHLTRDGHQTGLNGGPVGGTDDSLRREHAGVGLGSPNVLPPQALIYRQGRVEGIKRLGGRSDESATPQPRRLAAHAAPAPTGIGVPARSAAMARAIASHTRSIWSSVISQKNGRAIVEALMASVTGNSPGPCPWASR